MFLLIQPLTINYKNINRVTTKRWSRAGLWGINLERNVALIGRYECNKPQQPLRSTPVQNTFIRSRKIIFRVNSHRIWFQVMK